MNESNFQETFNLKTDLVARIRRILIKENTYEEYKLIPIINSAYFQIAMRMRDNERLFHMLLPKLYAALTFVTGEGDSCYDHYKGSYSFMFELEIQKNHISSKYLYHIYHYRSYIEFSVNQIVPGTDPRESCVMQQPDDVLFSDDDICYLSSFFCAYLLGYMQAANYIPKPFLNYSDSNLLIFGYGENGYFINQHEDPGQYEKEKSRLRIPS